MQLYILPPRIVAIRRGALASTSAMGLHSRPPPVRTTDQNITNTTNYKLQRSHQYSPNHTARPTTTPQCTAQQTGQTTTPTSAKRRYTAMVCLVGGVLCMYSAYPGARPDGFGHTRAGSRVPPEYWSYPGRFLGTSRVLVKLE